MSFRGKCLMLLDSPVARLLPDRLYLRIKYRVKLGSWPALRCPLGFNEKLQWLKLNDRNPLYHKLADKAEVKEYVASLIGREHIIRTLGVWDDASLIDWASLPQQFVIKCTHDSGSTIICKDKSTFDTAAASSKLSKSMGKSFYFFDREWAYKGVKARIIAEEYLGENVPDYKFFCFGGEPKVMFMASDRGVEGVETKFDFFDMSGAFIDMRNGHPNSDKQPELPDSFRQMQQLAAKLSQKIPQVRIDFYDVSGHIYFGEYTFYHWGGLVPFDPPSADRWMGDMIKLDGAWGR